MEIKELLAAVAQGQLSVEAAEQRLQPVEDLTFARLDHDRKRRTGLPEVVFGPGKTVAQLADILPRLHQRNGLGLATRVEAADAQQVQTACHGGGHPPLNYDPETRLLWLGDPLEASVRGPLAVVAAGTSDRSVAREAAETARLLGNPVMEFHDVGVAGLQRLLQVRSEIEAAKVVIAVAGMEAALFSVLKGLVSAPLVAVPTSVGGGFQGVAALLSALSACSSGVVAVGIDNGFGAAVAATLFNRKDEA